MTPVIGIMLFYFAVMFAIGYWAKSKVKSSRDFLIAGQSLGFFVMAIGTYASIQSGFGMIGHTANTNAWGLQALVAAALLVPVSFAICWFLLGVRLYKLGRKYDVYSIPDVIRIRYPSKSAHVTMAVAMFVGSVAYMTAQVTATGVIISLIFGTSIAVGAIIGSAVVAIYTIAGGMLAGAWTDFIQGLLMIVMSVAAFFVATNTVGGWSTMLNTIASHDVDFLRLDASQPLTYVFTFVVMAILGTAAQPHLITKFLMLRSHSDLKWGASIAALGYAMTTLFALGVGMTMRALTIEGRAPELENIDNTTTWFFENMVHPVFAGFVMAGLLAAIMSSSNSFITVGASALMRDLPLAYGKTVRNEVFWARVTSTIVVVCSLVFGLYLSQVVFLLGAIGWAAFASAIFGPLALGMYWRRATGLATTVAIAFGIVANLLTAALAAEEILTVPAYIQTGGLITCLGILIFIAVSAFVPSPGGQARFAQMYEPAPKEQEAASDSGPRIP